MAEHLASPVVQRQPDGDVIALTLEQEVGSLIWPAVLEALSASAHQPVARRPIPGSLGALPDHHHRQA